MSEFEGVRVRVGVPGLTGGGVTPEELTEAIDDAIAVLNVPTTLGDLGDVDLTGAAAGKHLVFDGSAWVPVAPTAMTITVGGSFLIDGGGSAIGSGVKGDMEIPFAGTITRVRVFQDQSGSIEISGWKDTRANYPPTSGDAIYTVTISSSAVPGDSGAVTIPVSAGDIIRHNVNTTATSITRVTVAYTITRSVGP